MMQKPHHSTIHGSDFLDVASMAAIQSTKALSARTQFLARIHVATS